MTPEVWPWVGAHDRAACGRALEALEAKGVVGPDDARWLARALDRRCGGAAGGLAIPWASWGARLADRARLDEIPGEIGVAAAAVAAGGDGDAPDAAARLCVAGRVIERRAGPARALAWLLSVGARPAASAPENPPVDGRAPGAPAPGAREIVALWSAPALLAGEDLAPWCRFGERLAEPVAVLEALARLWLAPIEPDLERAARTPLLALWLREPPLAPPLLRAFAGERGSPARRFEILSLVAGRPYRAALAERAGRALAEARAALPAESPLSAAGGELLDALAERLRFFDSLMAARDLFKTGQPRAAAAPLARAEADLGAAIAFLMETAPWPGSWEVQRFGVLGSADQPVSQWFARGTILQALLEAGRDVRAEVAALLDEIPPGGLRYYGAWPGIPPDADDLGLMLQLVAATGAPRARAETWIAAMLANVRPDGVVPTWFYRSPDGVEPGGAIWGGDDCAAVRLNLLAGLLSFDPARFDPLIQANARRVLEAIAPDRIEGLCFYDASYAGLAFVRFARLYRARAASHPLAAAVAEVEAALVEQAAASQRLDGGWGSPQRSAASLEIAATAAAPDPLLLERGARYLGERQLADGSWPAEPLYLLPMKEDRVGRHEGRELSTALCARALAHAAAALGACD